ncbi:MAG TPA: YeiH family protein, partial [Aquabacterium sp.]|nr:YeiH family protein [Aquabacterium sp.]
MIELPQTALNAQRANQQFNIMQSNTLPLSSQAFERMPGVILSIGIALVAMYADRWAWLGAHGFSALTLSILLGILVGNTVYEKVAFTAGPGVHFARFTLLRAGVILYGLRLTMQDITHVGMVGVLIDMIMLSSTFLLATWIGTRWLGLDSRAAMLIGAGSAICGAAAVMATEPVVKGRAEHVTMAVATVVVLGTVGIFAYPALYTLSGHIGILPNNPHAFGLYAGATIHEVAQVVAAARSVSTEAANVALITKMVRVMLLAPFLMLLSYWLSRKSAHTHHNLAGSGSWRDGVPWFAIGFVLMVVFNSMNLLPLNAVRELNQLDTVLLATAMAALGLSTQARAVRQAGTKP